MAQQKLDTPFEGGLGSFKLYVLVAHHIQRHLQLGGADQPGEILLSFLFRYGGSSTGDHCVHPDKVKTQLSQDVMVKCHDTGCDADMSNVFLVDECCHLFASIWKRLWKRMRRTKPVNKRKSKKNNNNNKQDNDDSSCTSKQEQTRISLLAELIHVQRLTEERQQSLATAAEATKTMQRRNEDDGTVHSGTRIAKSSAGVVVVKRGRNKQQQRQSEGWNPSLLPSERTAAQLAASYGVSYNDIVEDETVVTRDRRPAKRMRI